MVDQNQNAQLKPGDVVQLKSGGPVMTIETMAEDRSANCIRFVDGDVKARNFETAALLRRADYADR